MGRIRRSGAKAKRFSSASRLIEPSGAQRTTEKGNERARSVTLKKRRSCRRRPLLFACLTCSSLRERERERERGERELLVLLRLWCRFLSELHTTVLLTIMVQPGAPLFASRGCKVKVNQTG